LERIRVLLVGIGGILGEIISEIVAQQPDMEIVGQLADDRELVAATRSTRCDAVILGLAEEEELPAACLELLEEHPGITILTVLMNGSQAFVYRLKPERVSVGDLSTATLADAIRGAARPHAPSL
jgi:DNA-binding NarL/FixJ family response regulator